MHKDARTRKEGKPMKWEYMMPELADDGMVYLPAIEQWFTLHDMGNDGWEFVATIIPMREFQGKPMARVLFKRPMEE